VNRRTALATALAITMSVTSGVVALSANAGALGFGVSTPVAATQSVVPSAAGSRQAAVPNAGLREGATSTKGEQND
jgi:hypothetical protein